MTFPGGTAISRLAAYERGGTPHLHTVSTEAYVVIGGSGALQTLDRSGFRETPLTTGHTVWFGPGVIHRAINHGDLRVVVLMSNAGLPEAGNAVMTFPPEVVADEERYRTAAALPTAKIEPATALPAAKIEPATALLDAEIEAAVDRRRALAVAGFDRLAAAMRAGDPGPLEAFYDSAAALVRPHVAGWHKIFESTVEAETRRTAGMLAALDRGDGGHLRAGAVRESPQSTENRWGMCGLLRIHSSDT